MKKKDNCKFKKLKELLKPKRLIHSVTLFLPENRNADGGFIIHAEIHSNYSCERWCVFYYTGEMTEDALKEFISQKENAEFSPDAEIYVNDAPLSIPLKFALRDNRWRNLERRTDYGN